MRLFAVYVAFYLNQISMLFDYLMLFLLGLFLGYRIAMKANEYSNTVRIDKRIVVLLHTILAWVGLIILDAKNYSNIINSFYVRVVLFLYYGYTLRKSWL